MPTREGILNEKTFKADDFEVSTRVFYTLALSGEDRYRDDVKAKLQTHRNTMAISLLAQMLHAKGILSDDEIDDLLFEVVTH